MSSVTLIAIRTGSRTFPRVAGHLFETIPHSGKLVVIQLVGMRVFTICPEASLWAEIITVARRRAQLLKRFISSYMCQQKIEKARYHHLVDHLCIEQRWRIWREILFCVAIATLHPMPLEHNLNFSLARVSWP
jgi:hypothetical protein